jgi:hypothetical protein
MFAFNVKENWMSRGDGGGSKGLVGAGVGGVGG